MQKTILTNYFGELCIITYNIANSLGLTVGDRGSLYSKTNTQHKSIPCIWNSCT